MLLYYARTQIFFYSYIYCKLFNVCCDFQAIFLKFGCFHNVSKLVRPSSGLESFQLLVRTVQRGKYNFCSTDLNSRNQDNFWSNLLQYALILAKTCLLGFCTLLVIFFLLFKRYFRCFLIETLRKSSSFLISLLVNNFGIKKFEKFFQLNLGNLQFKPILTKLVSNQLNFLIRLTPFLC